MTDWTPVVVGLGAFLTACATVLPSLVVVLQHRTTRDAVQTNTALLGRVEQQTNGALDTARSAGAVLTGLVASHDARLAALEAAQAAEKGAAHG